MILISFKSPVGKEMLSVLKKMNVDRQKKEGYLYAQDEIRRK